MPEPLTTALLSRVHARVQRNFIWVADRDQYGRPDHWQGFADNVRAGRPARGDCEDFAITCAEILRDDHGVDPAQLRLVYCKTARAGHMVLAVDRVVLGSGPRIGAGEVPGPDPGTATVVLDNRQRRPVEWTGLGYRWISGMRLSEPGAWRDIPG